MRTFLFALALTMFAAPVWAQQGPEGAPEEGHAGRYMGPPPSPEAQVKRLTKELQLSKEQATQLKSILEEERKQHEQQRESMSNLSPEERRANFMQTRQQMDQKIESILTDAQKQKFQELRSKHGQHHGPQGPPPDGQQAPPPDDQQAQ